MKTQANRLAVAIAIVLGTASFQSQATGIPTVDVAAIATAVQNAIQQATEAAQQLAAIEREISQTKAQFDELKRLTTGNSGYGSLYSSSELYDYLPSSTTAGSWQQIYSNMDSSTLEGYRQRYGLKSDIPRQQATFDKQLTTLATMESAYRANNLRLENLKNLQAEADRAETPQQKQDIANRLSIEQGNIANESNRLAVATQIMDRQEKLQIQKENREFNKFMSGE